MDGPPVRMTVQPGMCKRVGLFRFWGTRWRHAANAARFDPHRSGYVEYFRGTRTIWPAASTEAGKFVQYPVNLAGVPDALIFFCFFSSIKRRKEDNDARKILHQKNKRIYTLKISTYNSSVKIFLRFFREKFVAIQNSYTLAAA